MTQLHHSATEHRKQTKDRKRDPASLPPCFTTLLSAFAVEAFPEGAAEQNFIANVRVVISAAIVTITTPNTVNVLQGIDLVINLQPQASTFGHSPCQFSSVGSRPAQHQLRVIVNLCEGQIPEQNCEESHPRLQCGRTLSV